MATPHDYEPLAKAVVSIQPGGGVCYQLELAWGRWRRWWLTTFRPGYVRQMAALRQASAVGAPHPILDPRDLKYCRNQCTAHWLPADDPFAWRGRLGLARWGLAEVWLLSAGCLLLAWLAGRVWFPLAFPPLVAAVWVVSFFRDPTRAVPVGPGLIVAPADGRVVEITRLPHDERIGGPAVRIGIFLSIFNVHLNRAPAGGTVVRMRYEPGQFLNALRADSAQKNERMTIVWQSDCPAGQLVAVRQIAGQFARRIVCDLRPGERCERGQKFGMIKLGSRTELLLPDLPGLAITAELGRSVRAGSDVVARYAHTEPTT